MKLFTPLIVFFSLIFIACMDAPATTVTVCHGIHAASQPTVIFRRRRARVMARRSYLRYGCSGYSSGCSSNMSSCSGSVLVNPAAKVIVQPEKKVITYTEQPMDNYIFDCGPGGCAIRLNYHMMY